MFCGEKWCFNAKITHQVCGLKHSFRCIIFTGSRKIQISGSKDGSWHSSEKACREEFSNIFGRDPAPGQKLGSRKNGGKRTKQFWSIQAPRWRHWDVLQNLVELEESIPLRSKYTALGKMHYVCRCLFIIVKLKA